MKTIIVSSKLTENEFDELLSEALNTGREKTLEFDFSKTTFVSSFAMILFIILCENLIFLENKHVVFKFSKSGKECACMFILARLGFFDCLPSEISYYPYKPPNKGRRGSNTAILEVTEITDEKDAFKKIDLVEAAMVQNTKYPKTKVLDICTMVSEMLQNIFAHSEAKRHGLISIQGYPYLNIVQLVIADVGIGIPETIKQAEEFRNRTMTDEEAIMESVKMGVSRFGRIADRGEGLTKCLQLSAKHKAEIFIRSNRGSAFFSFQGKPKKLTCGELMKGTQIFVNFPMTDYSS